MQYTKDSGRYTKPLNYSDTFGKVDETALALINSCLYVYKDKGGKYTYVATSFDENGNVFFTKNYVNHS
jgi:hypothetical protein